MKKEILASVFCGVILGGLSGCTVRTYSLTKDRIDQDLSGNRGFIFGSAPKEAGERKATRTTRVVEVELNAPIKFEKKTTKPMITPQQGGGADKTVWGNKGYITGGPGQVEEEAAQSPAISGDFKEYTVQERDTLQKISKKFYGSSKKWYKIYDANRHILKSPDRIYPGQEILIPQEPLKETEENLK